MHERLRGDAAAEELAPRVARCLSCKRIAPITMDESEYGPLCEPCAEDKLYSPPSAAERHEEALRCGGLRPEARELFQPAEPAPTPLRTVVAAAEAFKPYTLAGARGYATVTQANRGRYLVTLNGLAESLHASAADAMAAAVEAVRGDET